MKPRHDHRVWLRTVALAAILGLLLAACGEDTDDGVGGEEPVADEEVDEDGAEGDAGSLASALEGDGDIPEFDLEGEEIRFTISQPGPLLMGAVWTFEKLREWGAVVDVTELSTTTGVQALIAGESDAGIHGSDEAVLGAAEGADVSIIGGPNSKMNYVLIATTDIEAVAGVEGATVAMSGPAGFDTLLTRLALEEEGLDPEGTDFVQIGGSPERAAALLSGNADAATVFLEDWFELSGRTEDVHLVELMAELFPQFPGVDAYFGNTGFWEEHPDLATAISCATLEANSWINSDQEGFVQFTLGRVAGSTREAVEQTYEATQQVDMFPESAEEIMSLEAIQELSDAMLDVGDISSPIGAEDVTDTSFLEEAASMGCGP